MIENASAVKAPNSLTKPQYFQHLTQDLLSQVVKYCDVKPAIMLRRANKKYNDILSGEIKKYFVRVSEYQESIPLSSHDIIKFIKNPDTSEDSMQKLIQNCGYVILIDICGIKDHKDHNFGQNQKQKDLLQYAKDSAEQEIDDRDLKIALEVQDPPQEEDYKNISQEIFRALKEKQYRIADSLVGKYLFTQNRRTGNEESEVMWEPIKKILEEEDEQKNTILHAVASHDDAALISSVTRSFDKAFYDCVERKSHYMKKNNDGDNPFHVAFRHKNFKSLVVMNKAIKTIVLGDSEIRSQPSAGGITAIKAFEKLNNISKSQEGNRSR